MAALVVSFLPIVAAAAPGDVDLEFGAGGKVVLPFFTARAIGVDARNRILAAGYDFRIVNEVAATQVISVARYDATGAADPTFGDAGVARIDATTSTQRYGSSWPATPRTRPSSCAISDRGATAATPTAIPRSA